MVDAKKQDIGEIADHHNTGNRVWDHEVRIRILERDYAEIKEIRNDVKAMQLELASVKSVMQELPAHVEIAVDSAISAHEKVEMDNQNKIMRSITMLVLTILGSVLYLVGEKAMEHFFK